MDLEKARAEIRANLKECCKDILVWHSTGILPKGNAHRIATEFCDYDLCLMEHEVNREAMEFCVEWM